MESIINMRTYLEIQNIHKYRLCLDLHQALP